MNRDAYGILGLIIFAFPFVALIGILLFKVIKSIRSSKKPLPVSVPSHKTAAGSSKEPKIGDWVQVKDHTIIVHKLIDQSRIDGRQKERVIYVDMEYKNEAGVENLSCRRNQWYLFDQGGFRYEAEGGESGHGLYKEKHYFGGDRFIIPGMNARGWLAFPVPVDAPITVLQFVNQFVGTKTANFKITDIMEPETAPAIPVDLLAEVRKNSDAIHQASEEFLKLFNREDLLTDMALAAQMAGLKLLRSTSIDLSKNKPGVMLLDAIPEEIYKQVRWSVFQWASDNRGDPRDMLSYPKISEDAKGYIPEVVQLEPRFDAICERYSIHSDHVPFVAVNTALNLAEAGLGKELLDAESGYYKILYNVAIGGMVVPG